MFNLQLRIYWICRTKSNLSFNTQLFSITFQRSWQSRPNTLSGGPPRGRGGSLERGGRISRGRGYQYNRATTYDGDQSDWSPRKEYNQRPVSVENWRRSRVGDQEEDGWRGVGLGRSTSHDKWGKIFYYYISSLYLSYYL